MESGRTREEHNKGIVELYDGSSGVWEDIWGEHMHHGYYNLSNHASLSEYRTAQLLMIEEALRFSGLSAATWYVQEDPSKWPKKILDVGCGLGGTTRYLANKYEANALGITLNPLQVERAQALTAAQGLADKATFQVADALELPFADGEFDLVVSIESAEHMPDKKKFVTELARVAAPGATIIILTWLQRDLSPSEDSLSPDEKKILNKLTDKYYQPDWCSAADYVHLFESLSLQDIRTADWSENVDPFWPAAIWSAITWKGFTSILRSGWKSIKVLLTMPLMAEAYKKGIIKYAIITCRKPE